jgi:hypothetical protein
MDTLNIARDNRPMARYHYNVYANDIMPRWVAVFGPQWQLIESHRLEPAADLYGAMTAAIARLAVEGWQVESEPHFGFTFIRRDTERRLLMLTPRDPRHTAAVVQSASVMAPAR